ncbi:rhodanese-related sulfurtransferase [Thioalkalivibrio sulfidiphilus HL-EbGr7]|uniref:Rhodanese-related sulfurtransferase n=1 Tax=Thioalkalivibrio sulfidiphilus (strain HL-EbGR7) TaxID=396588 RepID=B8GTB2_THISH|nr:rhodanese-related sulfurtransferase [Thioalkalivibrio sulfidiphilus]ACL71172.1 rhodanese-related sulfurtransferase [Thioalkalivibrio sulfidiphilus HL-EbGr7]
MRQVTGNSALARARGSVAFAAVLSLALAGCGGGESSSGGNLAAANINTPAQIAQVSADDYNENVNGLITGATLSRWINDWENERPEGVTGRLIILQNAAGGAGAEYVRPVPGQVFTYQVPNSELIQTRDNGVTVTVSVVPDGPSMDAFLKKYNIDPRKDMIVCAMGGASNPLAMNQGRCWYMFRYWGVDKRNLALLNGGNSWNLSSGQMLPGDFSATASTPPNTGTASVRDLPADNTALQASIAEMIAIATPTPQNNTRNGVFVWDARSLSQYSAGEAREMGEQGCADAYCGPVADYMTTFQNRAARQGHPHGTLQLQYTHMLVPGEGYRYKDKAELEAYLSGEADANGMRFVDYTYQAVGVGNAYQPGDTMYVYCETTFRAMITGVVSAVVLGLPTRFYDGAMTEWNSLSNIVTDQGTPILPADSPWRTDLADVSFFRAAASSDLVGSREISNPYGDRTDAHIRADRLYKFGTATPGGGSGGGGGVAPPANPCGG